MNLTLLPFLQSLGCQEGFGLLVRTLLHLQMSDAGCSSSLLGIGLATIHIILNFLVLLPEQRVLILEAASRCVCLVMEVDLFERGAEQGLGLEGRQGVRPVCLHQMIWQEKLVL